MHTGDGGEPPARPRCGMRPFQSSGSASTAPWTSLNSRLEISTWTISTLGTSSSRSGSFELVCRLSVPAPKIRSVIEESCWTSLMRLSGRSWPTLLKMPARVMIRLEVTV